LITHKISNALSDKIMLYSFVKEHNDTHIMVKYVRY